MPPFYIWDCMHPDATARYPQQAYLLASIALFALCALRVFNHALYFIMDGDEAYNSTTAKNWSLSRITPVDRCILRVAVYEMLHCPDIPYKVTLNEAIDLGKKFGTEKSGAFINGVLDNVLAQNPELDRKS